MRPAQHIATQGLVKHEQRKARCGSARSSIRPGIMSPRGGIRARRPTPASISSTMSRSRRPPSAPSSTWCSSPTISACAMPISRRSAARRSTSPISSRSRCSRRSSPLTTPYRPRGDGVDELQRAVPCRAQVRLARSPERRPRRLESRHLRPGGGGQQFHPRQALRAWRALRPRARIRAGRGRAVGQLG